MRTDSHNTAPVGWISTDEFLKDRAFHRKIQEKIESDCKCTLPDFIQGGSAGEFQIYVFNLTDENSPLHGAGNLKDGVDFTALCQNRRILAKIANEHPYNDSFESLKFTILSNMRGMKFELSKYTSIAK